MVHGRNGSPRNKIISREFAQDVIAGHVSVALFFGPHTTNNDEIPLSIDYVIAYIQIFSDILETVVDVS